MLFPNLDPPDPSVALAPIRGLDILHGQITGPDGAPIAGSLKKKNSGDLFLCLSPAQTDRP